MATPLRQTEMLFLRAMLVLQYLKKHHKTVLSIAYFQADSKATA